MVVVGRMWVGGRLYNSETNEVSVVVWCRSGDNGQKCDGDTSQVK